MDERAQTVEIASESITIPVSSQMAPPEGVTPSASSLVMDFDRIKHLLSGKPLRRPNRSRPLSR
jgi:hypothetical protein